MAFRSVEDFLDNPENVVVRYCKLSVRGSVGNLSGQGNFMTVFEKFKRVRMVSNGQLMHLIVIFQNHT